LVSTVRLAGPCTRPSHRGAVEAPLPWLEDGHPRLIPRVVGTCPRGVHHLVQRVRRAAHPPKVPPRTRLARRARRVMVRGHVFPPLGGALVVSSAWPWCPRRWQQAWRTRWPWTTPPRALPLPCSAPCTQLTGARRHCHTHTHTHTGLRRRSRQRATRHTRRATMGVPLISTRRQLVPQRPVVPRRSLCVLMCVGAGGPLVLAPDNISYLTNRAAAYAAQRLHKPALDDCLAALEHDPGNAKVRRVVYRTPLYLASDPADTHTQCRLWRARPRAACSWAACPRRGACTSGLCRPTHGTRPCAPRSVVGPGTPTARPCACRGQ
jgi:hypothetical protein